jgi:hypothetical protein
LLRRLPLLRAFPRRTAIGAIFCPIEEILPVAHAYFSWTTMMALGRRTRAFHLLPEHAIGSANSITLEAFYLTQRPKLR